LLWFYWLDFMNSAALKLVSKTLGFSVLVGTSRQKWWKALVGHWGWPLWNIHLKFNVLGIAVGNWENWVPEHLGAQNNCYALGSYWENWENHCRNSLSRFLSIFSPLPEANSPLGLGCWS
jgi:hypothetical protein